MLKLVFSTVHFVIVAIILTLSGLSLSAQNIKLKQSTGNQLAAEIDAEVKAFVDKGFSGAILVAKNSRIILNKTYGNVADSGKAPAFWVASNSKSFVAAAVLKLQEQKKLTVNDPLTKFFSNVPADKQQITVHHLLTHTSGLKHKYAADGIVEREKAVKALLSVPLGWKVGEAYYYSNDGYNLLAAIVEVSSNRSFEEYLQKEVLDAAKLKNTGLWGFENTKTLMPVANVRNTKKMPSTIYETGKSVANWGYRGATGIYSTTADLYKWMFALRNDKVLTSRSREQLWGR